MKRIFLAIGVLLCAAIAYCAFFVYDFITLSRGRPIASYRDPASALLVIDIQRDLTEPEGKASLNPDLATAMIRKVNQLIGAFSRKGIPIISIRHAYKPNALIEMITKGALKEGTPGADMDPRLSVVSDHAVIKYKMDPFKGTNLDHVLDGLKVNHVYLTGLDAELCIDKTIRAACNRGLKVTVLKDGIGTTSLRKLDAKLDDYKTTCADIISVDELIRSIEPL